VTAPIIATDSGDGKRYATSRDYAASSGIVSRFEYGGKQTQREIHFCAEETLHDG